MRTTMEASGPVSAAEVWDRYARPDRWSEWAPYLFGVETSADRLSAGMTGRVRGPLGVSVPFVVTGFDEGEVGGRWAWQVRFGPTELSFDHGVEPSGTGTRTWLIADGPLPVLVLYLPLARLSLEMLVRRGA
ncbi:MAG TPA: SRPBCC family protein [Pseudonocardia sp.]|jgi:hypothetical protein|nr:SRPBCC family protein [Pseudonocardia sp.]